jgi:hypothetical protein
MKHRSFRAMPMPDQVIKKVNLIGSCKKQGSEFHFLHWSKEPYECTNTILEDTAKFQG